MKCPHCLENFHENPKLIEIGIDVDEGWAIIKNECPACKRLILQLVNGEAKRDTYGGFKAFGLVFDVKLIRPKATYRLCPTEVPNSVAEDFNEACLVLSDSPKASAALSRRCLQNLLRDKANVKLGNLSNEIQEVIDSGKLPSHLVEVIDAVRNIGNFASHPIKSEKTGEIFPVEPGEAEWNLDVLESLFDFYFVQPEILKKKKNKLNEKLKDAGKPPMK